SINELILDKAPINNHFHFRIINAVDDAYIAVEDIFIIVVLGLHHLIPLAEDFSPKLFLDGAIIAGIQGFLQRLIQEIDTDWTTIHGRDDLHIIESVIIFKAFG